MSYAPNPTGSRSSTRDAATARTPARGQTARRGNNGSAGRTKAESTTAAPAKSRPRGRPFDEQRDWKQLTLLAAGIAAGAAVGAGIALLFTNETGPQRRSKMARKARHLGHDAEQRWEDLAFTLKEAARSTRDHFRHRHAAEDETDVDD